MFWLRNKKNKFSLRTLTGLYDEYKGERGHSDYGSVFIFVGEGIETLTGNSIEVALQMIRFMITTAVAAASTKHPKLQN